MSEINFVWELKEEISDKEKRLRILKDFLKNLTPRNDGTPTGRNFSSKVENLTAEIVDVENEIKNLREKMTDAKISLFQKLQASKLSTNETEILYQRYCLCKPFKVIAIDLRLSESRMFDLHRKGLKKIKF